MITKERFSVDPEFSCVDQSKKTCHHFVIQISRRSLGDIKLSHGKPLLTILLETLVQ